MECEWWDDLICEDFEHQTVAVWEDGIMVSKNPWSVRVESLKIPAEAVDIVESFKDSAVVTLGDNRILRQGVMEGERVEVVSPKEIILENKEVITGELKVLAYLYEFNTGAYRRILMQHWDYYLDLLIVLNDADVLRLSRYMRSITPSRNKISKKASTVSAGGSTLAKVKSLVARARKLEGGDANVVAYGVGNVDHMMSYVSGVVRCYDTDSGGGDGHYYRRGNLLDWKEHVSVGDVILSDASYGETRDGGMVIPKKFYDVYRDMSLQHYVVCKVDKLEFEGEVLDVTWYREHNRECFVLLGPGKGFALSECCFGEQIRASNMQRMALMRIREYNSGRSRLMCDRSNLDQCEKVANDVYIRGMKHNSVVGEILTKFGEKLDPSWKELCMTPYRMEMMEVAHELDVELPCVLLDVGHIAKNKKRLYHSFFSLCEMEFDEDVGWVAMEYM